MPNPTKGLGRVSVSLSNPESTEGSEIAQGHRGPPLNVTVLFRLCGHDVPPVPSQWAKGGYHPASEFSHVAALVFGGEAANFRFCFTI